MPKSGFHQQKFVCVCVFGGVGGGGGGKNETFKCLIGGLGGTFLENSLGLIELPEIVSGDFGVLDNV